MRQQIEKKQNNHHELMSWRSWAGIIIVNAGAWIIIGLVLRAFNAYNPFAKALLPVFALFLFSVIIVSNVQNKKPWILWNRSSKE